ncbi:OB-fold domain-containing protein [Streptomyces sp. NPDC044780]|uniref:Zn-ribbon domain-containing OB-fold protein n=1 Tax=unclassified Streptomyces TaxID=2593676 RepID=UPI0033C69357
MTTSSPLRTAAVGVGTTTFGRLSGLSADDLGGWAPREALADAGLTAVTALAAGQCRTVALVHGNDGAPHTAYLPEPAPQPPYTVAVAQLAEGPELTTNIVGAEPAELSIGMPVEPVFGPDDAAEVRLRPVRKEDR